MKLQIKSIEGYKIKLWLPTRLLKSKFIFKTLIKKYYKSNELSFYFAAKCYKILKNYIKENGHFTLIDVADSEGNTVTITV